MAMEIMNNYNNYAAQGITESSAANSTKKKASQKPAKTETEVKMTQTTGDSKAKNTADYMKELEKLAPSVEFKVGNSFSSAKNGLTLTINPKLLEKMQNDPAKEQEMKELIRGVESMTRLSEGLNRASGWKTVFRHSYIDENGKYCHIALIRNEHGYKMSEELREERRKNSEKFIEKAKEKAAKKKEELEQALDEKKVEKTEEKSDYNKAQQFLEKKMDISKDGMVYMDDAEFKMIVEAMKEDNADKVNTKQQTQVGANLDLKI